MGLTKSNVYKETKITLETSWDDGGELDMMIARHLEDRGLPGTFYIVVDWVGKPGYLTWDQIKELDKRGFKIGSHTMTHPVDLKMVHDDMLHYEIQNSKDMLENVLGHAVDSFCYPRGRADERVRRFVAEAGYVTARGTGAPGVITVTDKLYLPGTIHIFKREEYKDMSIYNYAVRVLTHAKEQGGYVNIWGHSAEIEKNSLWGVLERVFGYAKSFYTK